MSLLSSYQVVLIGIQRASEKKALLEDNMADLQPAALFLCVPADVTSDGPVSFGDVSWNFLKSI